MIEQPDVEENIEQTYKNLTNINIDNMIIFIFKSKIHIKIQEGSNLNI